MTETTPGVVVGTAGYMSPEQASAQTLDFRSDQFSFGSMLYEMATGRKAFQRKTAIDTLAAILNEEPEPIASINSQVPAPLRWIVERCLSKEPRGRYSATDDLSRDLAALRDHLTEAVGVRATPLATSRSRATRRRVLLGAAMAAVLAVGMFAGWWVWKPSAAVPPTYRPLTFRRGVVWSARFAPDGQTVVYAASWEGAQKPELFSVRLESPESLRLTLPEGRIASISRVGEMLLWKPLHIGAGLLETGTLSQAPISGSAPRELLEDVGGADWSPDGSTFAVVRAPRWRYRLEFPVGKVLYETSGWISHPRVSPKGDLVAFLDHPVLGDDLGSVALVDRSGKKKILSAGWGSADGVAWSPSGQEVWFTALRKGETFQALHAVTRAGRLRTVATTPGDMMLQDVSRDGRALFVHGQHRYGFLGLLPGEAKERDFSGLDLSGGPILSADGKTVAFNEFAGEEGSSGYSVYQRKLDGSPAVRLGEGLALAISPDGKWILACLFDSMPPPLVLLPTGAGEPKRFPKDSIDHASWYWGAFLPDGKSVVFAGKEPGHPVRVFIQDLAGGAARPVTAEGVVASLLSPDGKSLLIDTEQGFASVPLEGGPSRPIRGLEPGDHPVQWASDARGLFVGHGTRELPARVFRVDTETGRREVWKEFTPADPTGIARIEPWAISPDGKTIFFGYLRFLNGLYLAEGLK